MKRATSSVDSIVKSDGASESRSSRSVTIVPASTGSACRQSVLTALSQTGGSGGAAV
jgi:hypothetical protein